MRILVVVRPDHQEKPGGDLVQAHAYATWLRARGHDASVGSIEGGVPPADLAFLFNIDLLSEWVRAGRALLRAGLPYVAVPIHHPWTWLEAFERNGRTGRMASANLVLRTPGARDRARDLLRRRSAGRVAWHLRNLRPIAAQAAEVLERAVNVVYIADGERAHLRRDLGSAPAGVLVRNGVNPGPAPSRLAERDVDVVVLGRIEQRKNQLRLAQALRGTSARVVFAGHVSEGNLGYAAELRAVVDNAPRMEFAGRLAQEEAAALLARSKVSASASWVEVASLVDIEAHVAGCNVVASSCGFTSEYGIDGLVGLAPDASLDQMRAACTAAIESWTQPTSAELDRRRTAHAWETTLHPLADLAARSYPWS